MERLHAIIYGRVQGVNFRTSTARRAITIGVVGWVRNLVDGSVEVLAEGDRLSLENFLSFLEVGPPSAQVTHVEVQWQLYEGSFQDFSVRG